MQHIHRGLASAEEVHQVNLVFCGSLLCQKAPAEGELKNNSPAEGAEKRKTANPLLKKQFPCRRGWGKHSTRCGVQAYRNRGWCDNCGYGQKGKWHGSWEEESKSKRQEQGEQEAKQEVANFEKKEVANFEKKEVANLEKKESQQLVNYLLSQGKSEQEAKEEASNFEKTQALQETGEKMAADAVQLAQEQKAAAEEKKAAGSLQKRHLQRGRLLRRQELQLKVQRKLLSRKLCSWLQSR